jgi:hypothetical protein
VRPRDTPGELPAVGGLSPHERERIVDLLERRRVAIADSMWHAPALVVAGQAFLLQVLTRSNLDVPVAALIMAAGILASATVGLSLLQQWDRERLHSRGVKAYAMFDPNRDALAQRLEHRERRRTEPLEWWVWLGWEATLLAFVAADVAAFVANN